MSHKMLVDWDEVYKANHPFMQTLTGEFIVEKEINPRPEWFYEECKRIRKEADTDDSAVTYHKFRKLGMKYLEWLRKEDKEVVRMFCDKCGRDITEDRDFRRMSITNSGGHVYEEHGEYINATINKVTLCRNCAQEVIDSLTALKEISGVLNDVTKIGKHSADE